MKGQEWNVIYLLIIAIIVGIIAISIIKPFFAGVSQKVSSSIILNLL